MSSKKPVGEQQWVDPDAADGNPLLSTHGSGSSSESGEDNRFRKGTIYRDWHWIIVWILQFILVVAIGLYYFSKLHSKIVEAPLNPTAQQESIASINDNASFLLLFLATYAFIFAYVYLLFVRKYTLQAIWCSLIFGGMFIAACFVLFCVYRRVVGIIICGLALPLYAWYIYSIQRSIPFAVNVIKTCTKCMELWPSMIGVALVGLVVQYVWLVIWVICLMGVFMGMNIQLGYGAKPVDADSGASLRSIITFQFVLMLFGMILSYFWTQQIIKNIVHTTVSGAMAWWYFLYPQPVQGGQEPYNPVWPALKRSVTTSFGSIVLASLVTAVVKAIRVTVQTLRSWLMSEDASCCAVACMCITECLLRFIEALVEYVNQYALTYVSIYGLDYFTAATRCYELMKRRGLDAVANDSLIDSVIFFGAFSAGSFGALFAALMYNPVHTGGDWRIWAIIGFFMAFILTLTVLSVLESTVVTLFVCLADDPAVLRNNKRDVYDLLVPYIEREFEGVNLQTLNQGRHSARGNNQV